MKIGYLKAAIQLEKTRKMQPSAIQALQTQRLNELVAYARQNSPFYRELYKNLGEQPSLQALPPTNKRQLMAVFNDWVTDRTLTLEKVNRFLADEDNIGRKLENKWNVYYTSGSTGTQCSVVYDKTAATLMNIVSYTRSFPNRGTFIKSVLKGAKICSVVSPGFYIEYSTQRSQLLISPAMKHRCKLINAMTPIPEIVAQLNQFQPSMLIAFPTIFELLLSEIHAGSLKIKPDIVMLEGENSTDFLRYQLRKALQCDVVNMYGATECGMMASECREGHIHINADWCIVEPVDEHNRPVPKGVEAHKYLLTNLSNYTQPFIRYEVTDRITWFDKPCKCGSPFPYMKVEGRSDDILEFEGRHGPVKVIPQNLVPEAYTEGVYRYQLVQKDAHTLHMRLQCREGYEPQTVYQEIKRQLTGYLDKTGIDNINIVLTKDKPMHARSGKFQAVYKEKPHSPRPDRQTS